MQCCISNFRALLLARLCRGLSDYCSNFGELMGVGKEEKSRKPRWDLDASSHKIAYIYCRFFHLRSRQLSNHCKQRKQFSLLIPSEVGLLWGWGLRRCWTYLIIFPNILYKYCSITEVPVIFEMFLFNGSKHYLLWIFCPVFVIIKTNCNWASQGWQMLLFQWNARNCFVQITASCFHYFA